MSLANALIFLAVVLSCLGIVICHLVDKLTKMHNDIKLLQNFLYKSVKFINVTDSQAYKNDDIISSRQFKGINQSDDPSIDKNTKNKLNTCREYLINIFASLSDIIKCTRISHKQISNGLSNHFRPENSKKTINQNLGEPLQVCPLISPLS